MIAGYHHEGHEVDLLHLCLFKIGQNLVKGVAALDAGKIHQGIAGVHGHGDTGKGQISGTSVIAVAHEDYGVPGSTGLWQGSRDSGNDLVEILHGFKQGMSQPQMLEDTRAFGKVARKHAFEHGVLLAGAHVQTLHTQVNNASPDAFVQGLAHAEDWFSL